MAHRYNHAASEAEVRSWDASLAVLAADLVPRLPTFARIDAGSRVPVER